MKLDNMYVQYWYFVSTLCEKKNVLVIGPRLLEQFIQS